MPTKIFRLQNGWGWKGKEIKKKKEKMKFLFHVDNYMTLIWLLGTLVKEMRIENLKHPGQGKNSVLIA